MAPDSVAWPMFQTCQHSNVAARRCVEPKNGDKHAGTGHSRQGKTGECPTKREPAHYHHQTRPTALPSRNARRDPVPSIVSLCNTLGGAGHPAATNGSQQVRSGQQTRLHV